MSSNLESDVKFYPEEVTTQYAISRILGSGAFGQVRLVFEKITGKPFAMKIIQKKRFCTDTRLQLNDLTRTRREVNVLKALSNVNFFKLIGIKIFYKILNINNPY